MKRASKFEASSQFRVVDSQVVPLGAVWKALPGWVVLARHHAEAIVRLDAKVGKEARKRSWSAKHGHVVQRWSSKLSCILLGVCLCLPRMSKYFRVPGSLPFVRLHLRRLTSYDSTSPF